MNLGLPDSGPLIDADGNPTKTGLAFLANVADWISDNSQAGPTTDRPKERLAIGQVFYDTTLGKPVWLHSARPVVWHDASGAVV
jgi:hypothetical protein